MATNISNKNTKISLKISKKASAIQKINEIYSNENLLLLAELNPVNNTVNNNTDLEYDNTNNSNKNNNENEILDENYLGALKLYEKNKYPIVDDLFWKIYLSKGGVNYLPPTPSGPFYGYNGSSIDDNIDSGSDDIGDIDISNRQLSSNTNILGRLLNVYSILTNFRYLLKLPYISMNVIEEILCDNSKIHPLLREIHIRMLCLVCTDKERKEKERDREKEKDRDGKSLSRFNVNTLSTDRNSENNGGDNNSNDSGKNSGSSSKSNEKVKYDENENSRISTVVSFLSDAEKDGEKVHEKKEKGEKGGEKVGEKVEKGEEKGIEKWDEKRGEGWTVDKERTSVENVLRVGDGWVETLRILLADNDCTLVLSDYRDYIGEMEQIVVLVRNMILEENRNVDVVSRDSVVKELNGVVEHIQEGYYDLTDGRVVYGDSGDGNYSGSSAVSSANSNSSKNKDEIKMEIVYNDMVTKKFLENRGIIKQENDNIITDIKKGHFNIYNDIKEIIERVDNIYKKREIIEIDGFDHEKTSGKEKEEKIENEEKIYNIITELSNINSLNNENKENHENKLSFWLLELLKKLYADRIVIPEKNEIIKIKNQQEQQHKNISIYNNTILLKKISINENEKTKISTEISNCDKIKLKSSIYFQYICNELSCNNYNNLCIDNKLFLLEWLCGEFLSIEMVNLYLLDINEKKRKQEKIEKESCLKIKSTETIGDFSFLYLILSLFFITIFY